MVVRSYGSGRWDWTGGSARSKAVRLLACDVCWQRQGHIHAANPLGDCTYMRVGKETCVLGYWHRMFAVNETQQEQETLPSKRLSPSNASPEPRAGCQSCHNGGVLPGQRRGINN